MFHQPSVVQPSFSLYPIAIPTRLPVLLQRRKSALAGSAVSATAAMMSVVPASARMAAAKRCRGRRRTPALVYRCFIPPRNPVLPREMRLFARNWHRIGTGRYSVSLGPQTTTRSVCPFQGRFHDRRRPVVGVAEQVSVDRKRKPARGMAEPSADG